MIGLCEQEALYLYYTQEVMPQQLQEPQKQPATVSLKLSTLSMFCRPASAEYPCAYTLP